VANESFVVIGYVIRTAAAPLAEAPSGETARTTILWTPVADRLVIRVIQYA
jgi:hypothetical protein